MLEKLIENSNIMTTEETKIGGRVTYCPEFGSKEKGIIKSLHPNKPDAVFVVYKCDGDWEHYQNYTAALIDISDLTTGW